MWRKTPVAMVLNWPSSAEPAAKSPACTVEVSPGRVAVPTSVQCVPSAESYPVIVPPSRTSRSQRGADADTPPAALPLPQAGRVVDVVPLHPHAVGPGDHHRRVRRALRRVLLDDDPGLGPRLQAARRQLWFACRLEDVTWPVSDVTCTVIVPFPVTGWCAK